MYNFFKIILNPIIDNYFHYFHNIFNSDNITNNINNNGVINSNINNNISSIFFNNSFNENIDNLSKYNLSIDNFSNYNSSNSILSKYKNNISTNILSPIISNTEDSIKGNTVNSDILVYFLVIFVLLIFIVSFIRCCSIKVCCTCIDNCFKVIIFIPKKICKTLFCKNKNNRNINRIENEDRAYEVI